MLIHYLDQDCQMHWRVLSAIVKKKKKKNLLHFFRKNPKQKSFTMRLLVLWSQRCRYVCGEIPEISQLAFSKWVRLYKVQTAALSWAPMDRKYSHEKNMSFVLVTFSTADFWNSGFQNQHLAASFFTVVVVQWCVRR